MAAPMHQDTALEKKHLWIKLYLYMLWNKTVIDKNIKKPALTWNKAYLRSDANAFGWE